MKIDLMWLAERNLTAAEIRCNGGAAVFCREPSDGSTPSAERSTGTSSSPTEPFASTWELGRSTNTNFPSVGAP